MVAWFVTIAVLGIRWLLAQPIVLSAVDPRHALTTWKRGRPIVAQRLTARAVPLEQFMANPCRMCAAPNTSRFARLARASSTSSSPPERVVELGVQVEI
jgi:K+ transporter